ncbi:MAG: hypothetical protein ACJA1A_001722 [Saprospiraceae bacterium]|jgi:hypothetical protein
MNKFLIIIFFAFTCFQSIGQGLTEKFTSFDIGLVSGGLVIDGSDLNLSFSENSIRELEYNFDKKINSPEKYIALDIAFKWGKYNGLTYSLFLNAPLSGFGKNKAGLSVGYNYPIEIGIFDLLLRPSLGFSGVNTNFKIGSIAVDTFGIVIDDTDYVDRNVSIKAGHSTCYLSPKFEMTFLIAQKFGIMLSASYDYAVNGSEQDIDFTADDFDSTALPFGSDFYNFTIDGNTPTGDLFSSNGMVYSLGISSYFNRE